ncbi:MAG: hypothetical protein R3A52_22480 [Polyangiales bacterium]
MARLRALGGALLVTLAGSLARAQSTPFDASRPGPTPQHASSGEPVAFARRFAMARAGQRVLLAYVENAPQGRGQLRTALFTVEPGEAPAVTRARDDVTVAPDARAVTLTWDGARGLAVWIVPYRAPPRARGAPRRRAVGLPPSTDDPLGPEASSGGAVMAQALDADGRPQGPARTVARENQRLDLIDVAPRADGYTVAWSGAAVTDDEVRPTARAVTVGADGAPSRPMATATGFFGDLGGFFRLARDGARTALALSGWRCAAREGEPTPAPRTEDASQRIERPDRRLMPQAPLREVEGPPIACGALALYTIPLGDDGGAGPITARARLASGAGALDGRDAVVSLAGGAPFARVNLWAPPQRVDVTPEAHPQDLTLRAHAEDEVTHLEPVPPPGAVTAEDALSRSAVARDLAVTSAGVAAVTTDHSTRVRAGDGRATPVARSEMGFTGLAAAGEVLLTREGHWSGPVRFWWAPRALAQTSPTELPVAHAVPPPPARPSRYPTTEPYVWDEAFARQWARARQARAVLMRYENMAGAMAARPEALTDPRMPGIVARRNQLRSQWESACGPLRARASQLARHGAGQEVISAVESLCQLHADLQLGVPVNPAL